MSPEIVHVKEGPYLKVKVRGERTKYISWRKLFDQIWDDYVRGMISDDYTRGILGDLGLIGCQVFHFMEQLQLGKIEYESDDYLEISYQ